MVVRRASLVPSVFVWREARDLWGWMGATPVSDEVQRLLRGALEL